MPQVWMNYQRQSTDGWSIGQILLDFSGGVLSLVQLLIDASFEPDWSGVIGNPVKLALGNISIFFDLIFIMQHYVLYRHTEQGKANEAVDNPEERLWRLDPAWDKADGQSMVSLHRRAKFSHGAHSVASLLLPDEQAGLTRQALFRDGFSRVRLGTININSLCSAQNLSGAWAFIHSRH